VSQSERAWLAQLICKYLKLSALLVAYVMVANANMSSVNGQMGQFGQTNCSRAKAGIHGFTMALAQEVATKGITVNTVSPGYIGTDMVRNSGLPP
jgi:NAD(P)-dependent dehydrogenase (short-subunit alcohol dehydrogenase family)